MLRASVYARNPNGAQKRHNMDTGVYRDVKG